MSKIDKIKTHIKTHKEAYITGGVCLLVGLAIFTPIIMKGMKIRVELLDANLGDLPLSNPNISGGIPVAASGGIPVAGESSGYIFNNQRGRFNTVNITQVVDSMRKGGPSWVVRCIETGEAFMSQKAAANHLGLSAAELSRHLNGTVDHVRGLHFERICMAA